MLMCFESIVLTILTSFAYSYKDFEAATQGPLRRRLLNAVKQNLKDQLIDISESDILHSMPFRKLKPPVVEEKELTVYYRDQQGNLIDANEESSSVLYEKDIKIIPNSIGDLTNRPHWQKADD